MAEWQSARLESVSPLGFWVQIPVPALLRGTNVTSEASGLGFEVEKSQRANEVSATVFA